MKKLLIVRHAKSSWENITTSDFDRPLNERGFEDAPKMAKRLKKKEVNIDCIYTSPALRALTTAEIFAKELNVKKSNFFTVPNLYNPAPERFYEVISSAGNDCKTVALFAHNPGITDFVNGLCNVKLDNMPTCGVFAVKCDIKLWSDFADIEKLFWFFEYPKL